MTMVWPEALKHPETLVFLIPIVAIIVGGIITVVKLLIRHRERMAMIEQGFDPDAGQAWLKAKAADAWAEKTAVADGVQQPTNGKDDPASVFYRPEPQTTR
jgi:hypothetical protein